MTHDMLCTHTASSYLGLAIAELVMAIYCIHHSCSNGSEKKVVAFLCGGGMGPALAVRCLGQRFSNVLHWDPLKGDIMTRSNIIEQEELSLCKQMVLLECRLA